MESNRTGHDDHPRLRLVWVEEWMSNLARMILPYLAKHHAITYVTAGEEIPQADFVRVIRGTRWPTMGIAGFELSRHVNRLYRQGLVDLALVFVSIGFGLRRVPFINFEGGSTYAEVRLFGSRMPWYRRPRLATGFMHYVVPEMLCNRRALRVITPSETLRQDIMRLHHLGESQVNVIPRGVEEQHLALYAEKVGRGLPPRLLYVGRLHFRKGIAAVVREFVRRRDIEVEFLIAGDGPDRAAIERAAAGDSRVKLLGHIARSDLQSILRTTNVFIFPTFYEGFPNALAEAMASGHACVCYDIPVTKEMLGDCGIYVPLGEAAALIDRAAQLARDPDVIAARAEQAHNRATRFLSWDQVRSSVDRLIYDVYRETVAVAP